MAVKKVKHKDVPITNVIYDIEAQCIGQFEKQMSQAIIDASKLMSNDFNQSPVTTTS